MRVRKELSALGGSEHLKLNKCVVLMPDWGVDYLKEDSCFATGNETIAFQEVNE